MCNAYFHSGGSVLLTCSVFEANELHYKENIMSGSEGRLQSWKLWSQTTIVRDVG